MYFFKNKKVISFLIFCFYFFLTPTSIFSQVVINEFSSASSDDWVELYNNSSEQIDLSGYLLIDGSESGNTKTLSCILASKGFLVIDWSNKLNNGGDIIKLKNGDMATDCVTYGDGVGKLCEGKTSIDLSVIELGKFGARSIDGEGSWIINTTFTKDNPNDGSQKNSSAGCITPTLIPTGIPSSTTTPTPTKTPTPTIVPSATKTPTPKPTIKIVNTPTSTPKLLSKEQETTGQILGQSNNINISPLPSGNISEPVKSNLISGAKISLVLGLLFCGIAIMIFTQRFQGMKKLNEKT